MQKLAFALFASALTLLAASPAHATWKWRDANGVVHVSDRPPPMSVPDGSILSRPAGAKARAAAQPLPGLAPAGTASPTSAAPAASAADKASGKDPELQARQKKQAEAEEAARREKEKTETAKNNAQRADNCKRATAYHNALREGMRIAVPAADGSREVLDDKGRADEIKRAQEVMARDCKPA
jgi:Domain of unknown function (DUF4124)